MFTRAVVQGIGHSLPRKVLTNVDLEQTLDTSDEWITQRTGIRERRVSSEDETTFSLSVTAAREALACAEVDAGEIELVVLATISGDYVWPATACLVQDAIGARHAGAFDVSAACAGFIYALSNASSMIETGQIKTALVIGADTLTKQLDWTDRSTAILFGDAASAVVLKGQNDTDRGVIKTVLFSDGSGAKHIILEGGGTRVPFGQGEERDFKLRMAGKETYRFAVQAMGDACHKVLDKAGLTVEDVDLFVPHQANLRIIDSAAKRLGLPEEKVFVNVHKYGNTSAASVPLGLYEAVKEGRLQPGMIVMTVGFGAGLVWGANLIRW
ncbi:MAG TPA: beta-ketoacyl-ACP synthase III [Fimbriimonas sp.]